MGKRTAQAPLGYIQVSKRRCGMKTMHKRDEEISYKLPARLYWNGIKNLIRNFRSSRHSSKQMLAI